jgi:tRNA-specific 2-thiouridylase
MGCDRLATGHYARIGHTEDDRYYVSAGADAEKDQSYFLFSLTQDVLRETLFPLGGYRKAEIRSMAREYGLPVAEKPESQEICFVQDNDYPRYIERRSGIVPPPGDILGADGRVLGRHRGIHRYTIGQRRGLGIAAPEPFYVVEIDPERNILIAGRKEELARRGFFAAPVSYMKTRSLRGEAFTKTRSMQNPVPVALEERDGGVYAYFNAPQIGITPGQASVFYNAEGDILGGGWIVRSLK